MRDVLLEILRALVESPEDLDLREINGDQTTFYELRCAPIDVGTVIGKNGKTISAIRTVINAIAHRDDRMAVFEVIEP
ncbi:MAG: KH domain-containing protein [Verrucomicrobia bacterium]|nr:KH domain-containing protein [Verrucomicrobiota bacterium]MCH8511507.1 KH domain-containing protein [Kiritimatiellia bacterium]